MLVTSSSLGIRGISSPLLHWLYLDSHWQFRRSGLSYQYHRGDRQLHSCGWRYRLDENGEVQWHCDTDEFWLPVMFSGGANNRLRCKFRISSWLLEAKAFTANRASSLASVGSNLPLSTTSLDDSVWSPRRKLSVNGWPLEVTTNEATRTILRIKHHVLIRLVCHCNRGWRDLDLQQSESC